MKVFANIYYTVGLYKTNIYIYISLMKVFANIYYTVGLWKNQYIYISNELKFKNSQTILHVRRRRL